ncbi:Cas10/Cmr2 second palm domain-containing protein [Beggiatoa alba]|nr:hypothetical protein [Beggiatoa alba]
MEGVNLSAVLDDTNQISVIRGASFLLRDAAKEVSKQFNDKNIISVGASIGLFAFEANTPEKAQETADNVVKALNENDKFKHFNFVVDIQAETSEFIRDKEALIARNRFRQMQQFSLVIPEKNDKADTLVCELTNLTPAIVEKERIGEEKKAVSSSVSVRLKYGREQKKGFYKDETGLNYEFTDDLHELSEKDNSYAKLADKIAVLYLDGNSFSKIQTNHCKNKESQVKFDHDVQGKRKNFLKNLLETIVKDPHFLNYNKVRLETLLWGGDEMLFVVPAWRGLQLLMAFYAFSQDWKFENERLTHAGGLVFCRAKTPIRRIRQFAQELADEVKNKDKDGSYRKDNFFDYMVLESIDYPSESPSSLRKKIHPSLSASHLPLRPFTKEGFDSLAYLVHIPKSQAYQIVHAINGDKSRFEEQRNRLTTVLGDEKDEDGKKISDQIDPYLDEAFPNQSKEWQWIHLVELWDYICYSDTNSK